MMNLPKHYDPSGVEDRLYQFWEEGGFFDAEVDNAIERRFSMVIPPPNITSAMHVGNALQYTLHDVIIRYKRMDGYNACWFPGMDHAGIATQNVVEKKIREENLTRHDLGRDEFIRRVWEWKDKYGGHIKRQMKALGTSPDWRRERFTLDAGLSRAVREVFVRLYEEGKIYRGERMINWCPRCQTALSDIEVEHALEEGKLYTILYPLKDSTESIAIATTRPETMLGDTAVAVNPDDQKHAYLIGKTAVLPLVGRELPIVAAAEIDPEFGTGILKVTPAHDPVDFEIGSRYDLPVINILNDDGTLSENAGPYEGLPVAEARTRVVEDLQSTESIISVQNYPHSIGHCQRCNTPVEPRLSRQWFVSMVELATPAIEAVRSDEVEFIPGRWKKLYFDWMENIKDWCISRQLWWGHQIPVWYCQDCGEMIVAREPPSRCPRCGSDNLRQDTDVLDTWFSSALFPFTVMGWPEQTPELDYFYPTSLLITGFDIIFFWVARMIMMGIHFLGKVPFRQVYFTPLVEDEVGMKMSSSRGNIIDPLQVKETHGMDALRFTLAQSSSKGRGMRVSMRDIDASRNFLNKIWNMARFVLLMLGDERPESPQGGLNLDDRFILSRLAWTIQEIRDNLDAYNFNIASGRLYSFVWHDFCDWYLELAKVRLSSGQDQTVKGVLYYVLKEILKLLHPFVPFISEEIWQFLGEGPASISIANFPSFWERDMAAEEEMEDFKQVVRAVRTIRSALRVPEQSLVTVLMKTERQGLSRLVEEKYEALCALTGAGSVKVDRDLSVPPDSARQVLSEAELFIPLSGLIDVAAERARLQRAYNKVEVDLLKVRDNLENPTFIERAPAAVVAKERDKQEELAGKKERLEDNLASLGE
jgi:valyl-tRNA synthetase